MAQHGAKVVTNNRKPGSSLLGFEKTELDFDEWERKKLEEVKGDAQTTADEIIKMGGQAVTFFGDIGDFKTAGKFIQTAVDSFDGFRGWLELYSRGPINLISFNIFLIKRHDWNKRFRREEDVLIDETSDKAIEKIMTE